MGSGRDSEESAGNVTDELESLGFDSPYDFRSSQIGADTGYRFGVALDGYYGSGEVVVGRDHRELSKQIKDALRHGLEERGREVTDAGLVPTDAVSYLLADRDASGGVAVTASHTEAGTHGLKTFTPEGRIFDKEELDELASRFDSIDSTGDRYEDYPEMESGKLLEQYLSGVETRYRELFDQDLSGMKVVVDPGNSVGVLTAPRLLQDLGVERDDLYLVNQELDPKFPGRGPDTSSSGLEQLVDRVDETGAHLGMAFDGDADRVVFADGSSRVSGDKSLAILAEKYLEESPEYSDSGPGGDGGEGTGIVCSANTSSIIEVHLSDKGYVDHTPVGAVFTAKELIESDRGESYGELVYGGQPNGHVVDPGFTYYDSGTLGGVVMAGILKEKGKNLSQVVDEELPDMDIGKINIQADDKQTLADEIRNRLGEAGFHVEENQGVYRALNERIPGWPAILEDGVGDEKYDRAIFRPSGTEPVVRVTWETNSAQGLLDELGEGLKR